MSLMLRQKCESGLFEVFFYLMRWIFVHHLSNAAILLISSPLWIFMREKSISRAIFSEYLVRTAPFSTMVFTSSKHSMLRTFFGNLSKPALVRVVIEPFTDKADHCAFFFELDLLKVSKSVHISLLPCVLRTSV